jgi:hypothetical protein
MRLAVVEAIWNEHDALAAPIIAVSRCSGGGPDAWLRWREALT